MGLLSPSNGPICASASSSSAHPISLLTPRPSRTHYFLTRSEVLKGVANRFVHSTAYLYFYASMALASIATVVLSLLQDCPGTLFYALELAINVGMIVEVGIRLTAFGKVSGERARGVC